MKPSDIEKLIAICSRASEIVMEVYGTAFDVEYKGPSDRVRRGQDAWFRAALRAGMSRDQFAVAKWSG